ncbi:MAG: ATP-dependent DNA helicase [Eubacterium sp.]|nr:ATP-dependent DNA helicase [Eubacterium sp.]
MIKIKISVRNLVEFILRSGDIDHRGAGGMQAEAMQRGSRIHRKLQKQAGVLYHAEVPLKMEFEEEHYTILLEGRADGIVEAETEAGLEEVTEAEVGLEEVTEAGADRKVKVMIDEIKGVFADISQMTEPAVVHLAQAKCYAYMYAQKKQYRRIGVRMTYVNLDTEEVRYFYIAYSFAELEEWFFSLMQEYKKWAQFQYEWRVIRQSSIKGLEFPFPYRKGQKELAADVYRTILRRKNLFIQAPTGTGKTLTTLFPAVKAVGEELGDKIFYLTAKTITAAVAKETLDLFYQNGYRAKTVQITAKEKLCLMEETECNPDACPYAKGHFDRVNEAVYQLLHQADLFTREELLAQARAHMVCPFELCLDTASWVDNIICDYNYVFDPSVYLKRFFAEGVRGDYLFLIDEAHNLVERGREMYSASLYKEDFLSVKKLVKKKSPKLAKELQKCNEILLGYKRECEQFQYHENISAFVFALMRLAGEYEAFLQQYREFDGREEVLELYFQVRSFLDTSERLDENYVVYSEHEEERFRIRLYCVDPSRNLQERLDKGKSTVFFSATLLPIGYYKSLLSTKEDNYAVYAETVFRPQQHLLLVASDVTSRYARRSEQEYERMAEYIYQTGMQKKGNYIVFFPSYKMMDDVLAQFVQKNTAQMECIVQKSGMKEADREEFLAQFAISRDCSMIAFCVMGGIFGEGIDLKQEQLIGAIIIGTGLPQVGNEREILKQFYDKRSGSGFDYAYRYPGMNKVLQAAGRVIRTVSDVGVIELLDERFLRREYRELFPREWENCEVCTVRNVAGKLREFWDAQK